MLSWTNLFSVFSSLSLGAHLASVFSCTANYSPRSSDLNIGTEISKNLLYSSSLQYFFGQGNGYAFHSIHLLSR